MVATARFLPVKIITDRAKIRAFAKATSPVIKLVDPLIGEKVNSLRCCACMFAVCYMSVTCLLLVCLSHVCCIAALTADVNAAYGSALLC